MIKIKRVSHECPLQVVWIAILDCLAKMLHIRVVDGVGLGFIFRVNEVLLYNVCL